MISIVVRKIRSGFALLRQDDPLGQLFRRAGENMRSLHLIAHGNRPLYYRHAARFPFVVVPQAPETRALYHRAQNYEALESSVITRWLETGDFALDCGANVGLMTSLMAACVGSEGIVWAIEAAPSTAAKLAIVIEALKLKQVTIVRNAVSDRAGEVLFSDCASSSEANAIRQFQDSESETCTRVSSVSLEQLLKATPGRPALVKMDIEGAEPFAFRGWPSLATCTHLPLFVFEVYPRGLARLGLSPSDIFSAMPLDRYFLWHNNVSWPNDWPESPRGIPFVLKDPFSHSWPMHSNVIAVPKDGAYAPRACRLKGILPPQESQGWLGLG